MSSLCTERAGDKCVVPGEVPQESAGFPHRPRDVAAGVEHRIPAAALEQAELAVPVPVQVLNAREIFRFGHRAVEDSDVMAMTDGLLHEGTPRKPGAANHKKPHPNPRPPRPDLPDAGLARTFAGPCVSRR